MKKSRTFTQIFFVILSIAIFTNCEAILPSLPYLPASPVNSAVLGLLFSIFLLVSEALFKPSSLKEFSTLSVGLLFGSFLGWTTLFFLDTALSFTPSPISAESKATLALVLFLTTTYFGVQLTFRNAEDWQLCLPFLKLSPVQGGRRDILLSPSALSDTRLIDFAATGLLNDQLVLPRFLLSELYESCEKENELIRNRAKRSLDAIKKLQAMPDLNIRYSDIDCSHIQEVLLKLSHCAAKLGANILVSGYNRIQKPVLEEAKVISLNDLATALKPVTQTGEFIDMKIQRYGKEAKQGVGYLDDGTMVVVNGGADFIGDTIRSQVLSVKHTSSGRMIFCNAVDVQGGEKTRPTCQSEQPVVSPTWS